MWRSIPAEPRSSPSSKISQNSFLPGPIRIREIFLQSDAAADEEEKPLQPFQSSVYFSLNCRKYMANSSSLRLIRLST